MQNHHGPATTLRAQKFPVAPQVRLAAQQAPTASPGLRLEHRLIEFGVSKEALKAGVLQLKLF